MERKEYEFTTTCRNCKTAIRRFCKKFPEIGEVWGEELEYMAECSIEFESDCTYDSTCWSWALHFQDEAGIFEDAPHDYYICVIERS